MMIKIFMQLIATFLITSALGLLPAKAIPAVSLTPENYLRQVMRDNQNLKGLELFQQSADLKKAEGELLFSPNLLINTKIIDDKKITSMPTVQGDENVVKMADIGISQTTRFGLNGKLSYGIASTSLYNTNPASGAKPQFTDSSLKLELTQPLWQNQFGRQLQQKEQAALAKNQAIVLGKRYEAQMVLFDAESKYWILSSIRQIIKIRKTNIDRTKNILDFNRGQVKKNLADETDLLQSEAQLKARTLDLQISLNDEKEAMRALNNARNIDNETVADELFFPTSEEVLRQLDSIKAPVEMRNDVKGLQENLKATIASNEIERDKLLPDLNLFLNSSLNSQANKASNILGKSFDHDHPYVAVGVSLVVPLDSSLHENIERGHLAELAANNSIFAKKKFDQNMEWKSLNTKIALLKKTIFLAKELREAHLAKLKNELTRQKNGHSTTFQVFQFEQEYLLSELKLVQLQTDALALIAQSKTFNDLIIN